MRIIMALFCAALLWAILGKLDIVAVAPGKTVVGSRTKVIQPVETAVIRKILVQDGKAVGAAGFHVLDGTVHIIRAKTVISALGRLNGRVSVNSSLNPFNSAFQSG